MTTDEQPAGEDRGVVFPLVNGQRSTTATGQAIFADAARAVDPRLADRIGSEGSWYGRYVPFAGELVEAEVRHGPAATAVPSAGLASVHDRFRFRHHGEDLALPEALEAETDLELSTVTVEGRGSPAEELEIPYRGQLLTGDALHRQIDRWLDGGIVEPTFGEALRRVMANPDWLDLSDRRVVVLGAGAEMGPLAALCRWNAHVVPVDVPRPALWQRILGAVRQGRGRATVPVRDEVPEGADPAELAGADLVTELPAVVRWIRQLDPGPLTLGNYVYADGALNVRVSVAVDLLAVHLAGHRRDLSFAVLATPTDVYAVPEETRRASRDRFSATGQGRRFVQAATGGRLFAPNYREPLESPDGRRYGLADCLVPQQGPNYALAKRLHRWRARWFREHGSVSSINVAPPTRTVSVTRNRILAAAYEAASAYGVEVFAPETSRVLMAAMLVHDLRAPAAAANPGTALSHPLDLLSEGAAHGGLWRIPFAPRTVLPLAVVRGMVGLGRSPT